MDNPPGNWEKIKNSLLKSGIPLEVSTCKKLVEYGYHDFGEYFYERNEKIFSLDMHGTKFIDTPISSKQGCIELLIECKYREPNKAWYFFSFKGDIFGLKRENPTNIFIDLPLKEIILNNNKKRKRTPEEYISHTVKEFILYPKREKEFIPISGKGIEEIETKTDKKTQKKSQNTSFEEDMDVSNNPYSLKHGIYQLRFGSASFVSRTFETYADGFFEDHLFTAVFPILVTTAKLYYQDESLSLEEFVKNNDFKSVFKEVGYLIYHQPSDDELRNYLYNKPDLTNMKKHYNYVKGFPNYQNMKVGLLAFNQPNCFYVVNYNMLEDFITKLEKNIKVSIENILGNYPEMMNRLNKKYRSL